MRCPLCGKDLYADASHWGHGTSQCGARAYATLEDFRSDLAPYGISDPSDLPKGVVLSKQPLVINRALALLIVTAPEPLKSEIAKRVA